MRPKQDSAQRADMLQTNTAVVIVLIAVLALTLVAVLAGLRAARNEARAKGAEAEAQARLWNAYIAQAHAIRATSQVGRRQIAMTGVSNAAAIRQSPELRTEAIASLALSDLIQEGPIAPTPRGLGGEDMDSVLNLYAYGDYSGNVFVGSMRDGGKPVALATTNLGSAAHTTVGNLAFSPDGHLLAARFEGGVVGIWNLETHTQQTYFGSESTNVTMTGLAFFSQSGLFFTPDSKQFLYSDPNAHGLLTVLDLASGHKQATGIKIDGKLFRMRPDMKVMAVANDTKVELLNYPEGTLVQSFAHTSRAAMLAWSPDQNRLAVSCEDGDVYLWDVTAATPKLLPGHSERCISLGFSPDGKLLFSSSRDGRTRLWDALVGQEIAAGEGVAHGFSPDSKHLGFWRLWTGFGLWTVQGSSYYSIHPCAATAGPLFTYDLSVSGRWCVAIQNEGFRLWDLERGEKEYYVPLHGVLCVRFAPDEKLMYVCTQLGLSTWPLVTNEAGDLKLPPPNTKQIPLPAGRGARAIALSMDGRTAAVELTDKSLIVIDPAGERETVTFKQRWGTVNFRGPGSFTGGGRFVVSPDGRWVATGFNFGGDSPKVWDAGTGDLVTTLKADSSLVGFSPDGSKLALAGVDYYSIWSTGDWKKEKQFTRDEFSVTHGTLAFTRNNSLLAFGRTRQVVQIRNPLTDEPVADLLSPVAQSVNSVRLSADGSVLATATANDMVEVWHLDKLNGFLAGMNLGWGGRGNQLETASVHPAISWSGWRVTLLASLAGFGLALFFAIVTLRRHRAAIERFVEAEGREAARNRELEMAKIELMHSQKMQALGTLAAGIAHDFNNLLSIIRMSNKLIGRAAKDDAEIKEHVDDIEQASVQGKNVVRSMLGYTRDELAQSDPTNVNEIIERTVSLLNREFLSGIQLTLELSPNARPVTIHPARLEQVLLNLVVNASEAMQGRGKLKISAQLHTGSQRSQIILRPKSAGEHVELTVGDSGPGIPAELIERIFEPFFSTKRTGSTPGTGLGLSLVYSVAQQDGLGLSVESRPGAGSVFAVLIPIASKSSNTAPARGRNDAVATPV